ncbi:MAG: response regulator [Candidatus Poribacteria bacterium]|nr:response regulator [Candidatus Poribacteria bacterium]
MKRKHILVVDDERDMLDTLGFILQAANYKVTSAENGQQALEKICESLENHSPIDLLITDIQMPRLTGLQLMEELNRLKIKLPIFVITGYADRALLIELMRTGYTDYLDKPFRSKEFVKRVNTLFERTKTSHSGLIDK